jgi:hypothetical protein
MSSGWEGEMEPPVCLGGGRGGLPLGPWVPWYFILILPLTGLGKVVWGEGREKVGILWILAYPLPALGKGLLTV